MTSSVLSRCLALGAALAASATSLAAQTAIRPLELDHVVQMRDLVGQGDFAALSPDARWIAYAVLPAHGALQGEADDHDYSGTGVPWNFVGAELRLTDVRTGETKPVATGPGSHWHPHWSPDGRSLVFISDQDGATRLWMWDRETGATRRVSAAIVRSFFGWEGVRWLPDGKHVVVKVLPDSLTVSAANAASAQWVAAAQPAPGAVTGAAAGSVADAEPGATVAVYRAHAAAPRDSAPDREGAAGARRWVIDTALGATRYFADLAVLDVASGRVARRLIEGGRVMADRLSPDGTRLAVVEYAGSVRNTQDGVSNLSVVSLRTGEVRRVVSHVKLVFGTTVSWSPDGTMLAYVTSWQTRPGELCIVAAAGGAPRCFGTPGQPDFRNDVRPPLWGPDSDALYAIGGGRVWKASVRSGRLTRLAGEVERLLVHLVPDATRQRIWSPDGGRSLYVEARDTITGLAGIYKVDATTGAGTRLREEPARYGGRSRGLFHPPLVSSDGRTIVYTRQSAQQPEDIWVAGIDYADPRRITRLNPAFEQYTFGAARVVTWRTADGLTARGSLLLPAGYEPGRRYPLLVRVYGGTTDSEVRAHSFGLEGTGFSNMQMLATRGYAVLFPDIPQRLGTPMRDIAAAVLPGVDKLVELGIADPDRIGVFGQSYGGYSTLSLLVQTTRFKAGAMSAGPADLVSGYGKFHRGLAGAIGWSETGQGLMGGTPWQYRDRYIENSPIFYLDRVTAPLLIIHGERDLAVPVWQGDAVFAGLRRLGKEVEYRRYAGEEHVVQSPANMRDYWSVLIRWFDTHVKGAE